VGGGDQNDERSEGKQNDCGFFVTRLGLGQRRAKGTEEHPEPVGGGRWGKEELVEARRLTEETSRGVREQGWRAPRGERP